jgi:hypothetical protein
MGSCSKGIRPTLLTLDELSELEVGKTYEGKGCCPNIGGVQAGSGYDRCVKRGFSWPNNGEFGWGGLGTNCRMCSGAIVGFGCESAGCASFGGKKPTVKRLRFGADATSCCLADGAKTIGNLTCDKKFRSLAGEGCKDVGYKYCVVGDRLLTDARCKKFAAAQPSLVKGRIEEIMNDPQYIKNSWAQDWCAKNPGMCDKSMAAFCNADPTSSRCLCLNSKVRTVAGMDLNPKCVDSACMRSGAYTTQNMKGSCQITAVECKQYNTLVNSGVMLSSNLVPSQNCSVTSGGDVNTTTPPAVNEQQDNAEIGLFDNLSTVQWVAIVMIIILVICVLIYVVFEEEVSSLFSSLF